MATRGNRPKEPEDTKGGVRGTHGLGDARRTSAEERGHVATQGGTASVTGGSRKGGTAHESRLGSPVEGESDRTAGSELEDGADLSARDLEEGDAGPDELTEEEKVEHHLATEKTHGPGPNDVGVGTATKDHLAEHGLSADAPAGRRTKRGATDVIEEAPRKR